MASERGHTSNSSLSRTYEKITRNHACPAVPERADLSDNDDSPPTGDPFLSLTNPHQHAGLTGVSRVRALACLAHVSSYLDIDVVCPLKQSPLEAKALHQRATDIPVNGFQMQRLQRAQIIPGLLQHRIKVPWLIICIRPTMILSPSTDFHMPLKNRL
jgi:hypothetical protein